MKSLKGKQLDVDDVNKCLDLGWEFNPKRCLVHPTPEKGFSMIPYESLEVYFTETNEGLKKAQAIAEERIKLTVPPVRYRRQNYSQPEEMDLEQIEGSDNENLDLLDQMLLPSDDERHQSKLQRACAFTLVTLLQPTAVH